MSDVADSTATIIAAPAAEAASIVVPEGRVLAAGEMPEKADITDGRQSLFEDEKRLTQEELTGEEEPEKAAPTDPPAPGAKESVTPPPAGEEGKDLTAEQKAAAAEAADKDPVVKATEGIRRELTTERAEKRALAQQLETAQRTINELQSALTIPAAPASDPMAKFKDFKELSDDEYADLVHSDYAEAQLYVKTLADYREAKRSSEDQGRQRTSAIEAMNRNIATIVEASREEIAREVPGIYDDQPDGSPNEINVKLIEFAKSKGMDAQLLIALTDPASVLTERDAKAGKYLGRGAASTIRFLKNTYEAEQQIETRLREEITKEVMEKFKINAGVHVSLGDHPAATTTPEDVGQMVTEDQLRAMSEAERQKYLGG